LGDRWPSGDPGARRVKLAGRATSINRMPTEREGLSEPPLRLQVRLLPPPAFDVPTAPARRAAAD